MGVGVGELLRLLVSAKAARHYEVCTGPSPPCARMMADHRSAASLMRVRLGRLSGDKSWVGWWVVVHWVVIRRVVQGRRTGVWGPVDGWDACHGRWAAEFL
jgi:hypothetical protein